MAEDEKQNTLVDRWITKLKNHSIVAAIIFFGIALSGVASFTESISKVNDFFSGKSPEKPQVIVQIPQTPTPPPRRVNFREEFSLGERDTFVSDHGVTVGTGDIMILEGKGLVAQVGASAKGSIEWFDLVKKGRQFELSRSDCDSLMVSVKDIQFSWPKEMTMEQLTKMGPVAETLVTRKVVGMVSGKCEE